MEDVITQRGGPIASCFQSFEKLRLHFPIHLLWKSETSARFLGCSTLGLLHSLVAGRESPSEILSRIFDERHG